MKIFFEVPSLSIGSKRLSRSIKVEANSEKLRKTAKFTGKQHLTKLILSF